MMCIGRGAAEISLARTPLLPERCAVGGVCSAKSVDDRVEEIGEHPEVLVPLPKVLIVGTYDVGKLRRMVAPGQQHSGWLSSFTTCGSE
jgi:hypothetical protein